MALIKLSNNGVKNITSVGNVSTGDLQFISSSLPNVTFTVTVQSTGSGNKYYIDGVQQDTLSLYRGGTYTFDQSNSSNSGHPLRLSSTSDGTHNSGSEYTTGVTTTGTPGTAGAKTVIVVPQDAPTLYYYCSVHSGMGGTANISGVSSVDFTSGIDSTYKEYVFYLVNIHPSANPGIISFQATTDGTNFNTTVTSTFFRAFHNESDTSTGLQYNGGFDQAQGTGIINLDSGSGNDSDLASCGTVRIFNPSSTTFVKHFINQVSCTNDGNFAHNVFTSGYFNTTSAITGIRFSMNSGNIDAGEILLFGVN
jgi:hypothetical protein